MTNRSSSDVADVLYAVAAVVTAVGGLVTALALIGGGNSSSGTETPSLGSGFFSGDDIDISESSSLCDGFSSENDFESFNSVFVNDGKI